MNLPFIFFSIIFSSPGSIFLNNIALRFLQSIINLHDFQDAEPDLLANSASAIMERISEYGAQSSVALKALCRRRKGLNVEVRTHFAGCILVNLLHLLNSLCHRSPFLIIVRDILDFGRLEFIVIG